MFQKGAAPTTVRTTSLLGRPPLLRRTNAQLLLNLLRELGPCSKADLVRASGLSAPTVTNVVAHLTAARLVEPVGEGDSTGGRPPDIIRFRAESGCVAGMEIGPGVLGFLLADLDGRELGRSKLTLPRSSSTPSAVCTLMAEEVRRLVLKHVPAGARLLAASVGIPAIVNGNDGTVLSYTALRNWQNVPLKMLLTRQLRCPLIVENDTNLAAQGEHYRGAAQATKDFVFITIGDGVGAGIFIGGKLYHGACWSAGEIGYLHVPAISRRNPTIDEYGRLEKVLGAPGIMRSWRLVQKKARPRLKIQCAWDVLDFADAGNSYAKRILRLRANILADIVLNISLILNPSVILLGGEVGRHPALIRELKLQLEGTEFAIVSLRPGALGSSAVLWGAVSTALDVAIERCVTMSAA